MGAAGATVCLKSKVLQCIGLLLHFFRNAFQLRYDSADRGHKQSNPNGLLGALCNP